MKKISEHLGQIIVSLAAIALLIGTVVVFKAPLGNFFRGIIAKETNVGNVIFAGISADLSMDGGGVGNSPNTPSTPSISAGLYDEDDNLVASWAELSGTYGMDVSKDYAYADRNTDSAHPYYVLTNNSVLRSGTKLVLDDSVTTIGEFAFACTLLTSLTVSENSQLTTINQLAFYECTTLTNIELPASVTTISNYAFRFCKRLSSVTVFATNVPVLGTDVFTFCYALSEIKVPAGCGDTYKAAENWSEHASIIVELS